ncbi:hypothetical protein E1264_01335 [Actinomadura sp. KC216]|uniref:hypothetical protein n=1 Tax=Actinomadura sp. KC216 TaxID=2530370 RepID=UPI00104EC2ED|nr:hypothetical protein [Actinomadura sp. KC216]TDB91622.1 hypothetical protein E1264_01335 [Actinomadura sp. KC216]
MTELTPRQPAACDTPGFKALSPDLEPEVATWVRELRTIWTAAGVTMNRFAGRYPLDKGTLSRYLNGKRVPRDHWFLNTLLAIQAEQGKEVSQEVRDHLTGLHLEALKVAHPQQYQVRMVSDELELALVGQHEAERYVRALQEQLADRIRQIEELTDQHGRLRAAWDDDRAAMAAEKERLEREIAELEHRLQMAQERIAQTEHRCRHLEDILNRLQDGASDERFDSARNNTGSGSPAASVGDLPLTKPDIAAEVLGAFRKADARPQALALAARAADEVSVTSDPGDVTRLLEELRELEAHDAAKTWAERSVPVVRVTAPGEAARLLAELRQAGAQDLALELAVRVVTEISLTSDTGDVAQLLGELRRLNVREPAWTLAKWAARRVDVSDSWSVVRLLAELRRLHPRPALMLAERAIPDINVTNAYDMVQMLRELRELHAWPLAKALAERVVPAVDIAGTFTMAQMLQEVRKVDPQLALALAERTVLVIDGTNPSDIAMMLAELQETGAHSLAMALAERAVPIVDLAGDVAVLLDELWAINAHGQREDLLLRCRSREANTTHLAVDVLGRAGQA